MESNIVNWPGNKTNDRNDGQQLDHRFQLADAGKEIDPLINCVISAQTIRKVIGIVGETDRANAVSVMIDAENRVIGANSVSISSYNAVHASLRQIFKLAINTTGCTAIVIGHCHPSEDVTPTIREIMVTWQMVLAAGIIGINVSDHFILSTPSPDHYYSFSESGELDRMRLCVESMLRQFEIIE
jgi:DNA repair protein RadC